MLSPNICGIVYTILETMKISVKVDVFTNKW